MTATTLADVCRRFRALYMPQVSDALYQLGMQEQVLPSSLRPLLPDKAIVGAAFTVVGRGIKPPVGWDAGVERMRPYLRVFEQLQPESVLVSMNMDNEVGHFGELTGNAAQKHGCVGVVLDGNLRDTGGLRAIGLQVFYRDLSPLNGIGRWEMVDSQVPVKIGKVTIHPGDIVFGEFDGILVIPGADAERVLEAAEEIGRAEARVRSEMQKGISPEASFDVHGHI